MEVEERQHEVVTPAKPITAEVQPGTSFDRMDLSHLMEMAVENVIAKHKDLATDVRNKERKRVILRR